MQKHYYLPALSWQGETPDLDRALLQRVIFTAIRRAIASSSGEVAEILVNASEDQAAARENFSSARHQAERGT
jgi:hypothetical protein